MTSQLRLGIDVACKAAHRASLADATGEFIWSGRTFRTRLVELDGLWDAVVAHAEPDTTVQVVMEPTRNAWAPLAAWFTARGARVVLVPPEPSADLRDYSQLAHQDRPAGLPGAGPPAAAAPRGAATG